MALTCILSLRYNDDGTGLEVGDPEKKSIAEDDDAPDETPSAHFGNERRRRRRRLNEGCERVIRFCSPTNVASTLTPAHFAQVRMSRQLGFTALGPRPGPAWPGLAWPDKS